MRNDEKIKLNRQQSVGEGMTSKPVNHHAGPRSNLLIAQFAHQIRTPLASAMLYTEHLTQHPCDERSTLWLQRLSESLASIANQVENVLHAARTEAMLLIQTELSVWLDSLINGAQALVESHRAYSPQLCFRQGANRPLSKFAAENSSAQSKARLKVRCEGFETALPLFVCLNAEALNGAVYNLINNALDAQAQEVFLTLRWSSMNNQLSLEVRDNGVGVSSDHQHKLFSPLFTTKTTGHGLGLSIVKTVVEAHGGEVVFASSPGQGSCVTINLPGLLLKDES